MLRGLLLGASWGGLIAATAVTTVSLVYSNANRAPIADQAPIADTPTTVQNPEVSGEATSEATDAVAMEPVSPAIETPSSNDVAAKAPEVMIPSEEGTADVATTNEADTPTVAATDAPQIPSATAVLPTAPTSEVAPEADTQAAAMTAPEMQDAPETGESGQDDAPSQSDTPNVQITALPQITTPDQPQSTQQDATLEAPKTAAPPVIQAPTDSAPKPAPKPEPATESGADSATKGQFDTTRVPVPKITNLAPNVKTNRLPSIGGTTDAESDAVEIGQETTPAPDKSALVAHAMTFENPDAKPMFSVILIDDPQTPISDEALSHLPFALSFAIDAARDDAYATAARYRAAGFEVLMLTNLPFGANATDIEVAFGAYGRAIPEAVGVLDLGANGFLRGPSTATQIAGIMSEKGYGLITPSKGLNSAQKAALREGVPAALVFRVLDESGEKPTVIRRYLDRAAFRAAQEGSVIMLGHTRPDTIEALVTWALEDRAAAVAIAPVSAVLLDQ